MTTTASRTHKRLAVRGVDRRQSLIDEILARLVSDTETDRMITRRCDLNQDVIDATWREYEVPQHIDIRI